jgi:hypothetical protein
MYNQAPTKPPLVVRQNCESERRSQTAIHDRIKSMTEKLTNVYLSLGENTALGRSEISTYGLARIRNHDIGKPHTCGAAKQVRPYRQS